MANPPITIGPFNNVPAPGSPIASAWAQSITTDYNTKVLVPVHEYKVVPLAGTGMGLGNSVPWSFTAVTIPPRPYPRIVLASVSMVPVMATGDASAFDVWLTPTANLFGGARRARVYTAANVNNGATLFVPYSIGPGNGGTITPGLMVGVGTGASASLVGGGEMNFLAVTVLPGINPAVALP